MFKYIYNFNLNLFFFKRYYDFKKIENNQKLLLRKFFFNKNVNKKFKIYNFKYFYFLYYIFNIIYNIKFSKTKNLIKKNKINITTSCKLKVQKLKNKKIKIFNFLFFYSKIKLFNFFSFDLSYFIFYFFKSFLYKLNNNKFFFFRIFIKKIKDMCSNLKIKNKYNNLFINYYFYENNKIIKRSVSFLYTDYLEDRIGDILIKLKTKLLNDFEYKTFFNIFFKKNLKSKFKNFKLLNSLNKNLNIKEIYYNFYLKKNLNKKKK